MSPKNPQFKFKYIFTYDYNPVYTNGAHGGISPRGELVMNFYQERLALPNSITHDLNPNGTIGNEVAVDPQDLNQSLVRFVTSGIVVNYHTALELHAWLGEKLKEMEALEQARAAILASQQEGSGTTH